MIFPSLTMKSHIDIIYWVGLRSLIEHLRKPVVMILCITIYILEGNGIGNNMSCVYLNLRRLKRF